MPSPFFKPHHWQHMETLQYHMGLLGLTSDLFLGAKKTQKPFTPQWLTNNMSVG